MTLPELFQLFLRERRYIKNSSENTIYFYENSLKAYQRVMGDAFPTKQGLARTSLSKCGNWGSSPPPAACRAS